MGIVPGDTCRTRNPKLATVAAVLLAASHVAAGEETTSRQPPLLLRDEFDWVQTTSSEWLKGEIVETYDEMLAFDSDEAGLQVHLEPASRRRQR